MVRRLALLISLSGMVLVGAMTIACGRSTTIAKPTCVGGPYDVVGDWTLTVNGIQSIGVVNSSGSALFLIDDIHNTDFHGDEFVLPNISGTCSFSGELTLYVAQQNFGGTYSWPANGSVQSGPVIGGTYSTSQGTPTFLGVPDFSLISSPVALNSTMTLGDLSSATGNEFQVQVAPSGIGNSANMTFTGTGGINCNVSGTFMQEGSNLANLDVFDTTITFTGTGCPVTGTLNGLGFESSVDYSNFSSGSGPFLFAISSNSANVIEIYPFGEHRREEIDNRTTH